MNKLEQSIEMFNKLVMDGAGVNAATYEDGSLEIKFDPLRILELRSQTESFDQKFGEFILNYIERSSLEADRADIHSLLLNTNVTR